MSHKEKFDPQLVYWVGVGFLTKACDYVVFLLTLNFTNNIPSSNLIAAISSISLNFNLHSKLTFGKRKKKNSFWKYALSTSIFLVLETALLIFSEKIGLEVRVVKALTLFSFTILGALILDRWVFKHHN
jgi:putative flippase GtrA